ncbi:MAG TPA: cupin domain-containing protein [Rhodocyclaceae bacterium]|nr:cupin domain-containing protein [Rhodocyclaceae bacterium]
MIYKRNEMVEEHRSNVHGGSGDVTLAYLLPRNTHPNLRLLTYMNVAPGATIGPHHHRLETEYYLLLKGSVTVDDDGHTDTLQAGDLLQTGNGQYHGLNNTGSETAELLVFVVTHAGHPQNVPPQS